jgi:hypothetical protein
MRSPHESLRMKDEGVPRAVSVPISHALHRSEQCDVLEGLGAACSHTLRMAGSVEERHESWFHGAGRVYGPSVEA